MWSPHLSQILQNICHTSSSRARSFRCMWCLLAFTRMESKPVMTHAHTHTHPDSLYAIYLYFLHTDSDETARPVSKHLYTVYRKSDSTAETLEDIWSILLWELKALASGFLPLAGEERKPLTEQRFGELLTGKHCFGAEQAQSVSQRRCAVCV